MNYTALVNRSVTGKELLCLFSDSTFISRLYSSKLIYGPSESLKVIEEYYGVAPSMDGGNIHHITQIRDLLFELTVDKRILNSFAITAPHTHWIDKKPIILKFDSLTESYIIGQHAVECDREYTPVSFVFADEGLLPYEWVDETVSIDSDEWSTSYNLISTLNSQIALLNFPLGIALDFRFKSSLFESAKGSLENPMPNSDFSYISRFSDKLESHRTHTTEQVSWNALSELVYDFSDKEKAILKDLREDLGAIASQIEREELLLSLSNIVSDRQ